MAQVGIIGYGSNGSGTLGGGNNAGGFGGFNVSRIFSSDLKICMFFSQIFKLSLLRFYTAYFFGKNSKKTSKELMDQIFVCAELLIVETLNF